MRILVVPDKFKGTLTAQQAAQAIAAGWRDVCPRDELQLAPMSDGGDGFGPIVGQLLGAEEKSAPAANAAHDPISAQWWWSESRNTAIVESARVIGLAMLPPGRFHPFEIDTIGLGVLLRHIAARHPGCRLVIGIGGSATNDAGFGMARGLGFSFEDPAGYCIERWLELERLAKIRLPEHPVSFGDVTIACDVQNPLLGAEGASRVYGPQKGLRPEDFPAADRCFERFTQIIRDDLRKDFAEEPGAGAAGGLGYGLRVFLDGRFKPGFEIFSEAAGLQSRFNWADLIITGEGAMDRQTQMGKGTGAIAELARRAGKRCIGLAGFVAEPLPLFEFVLGITPGLTSPEDAKAHAAAWLQRLSARAAARISQPSDC